MPSFKSILASAVLAASLCLVLASPAAAGTDTHKFTVGTLHIEVHGKSGSPIILIPGLGSGPWVWQATIEHMQAHHRVYALTLAGFDGTQAPAKKTGLMPQTEASLLKLIRERKLDKPVLIGHSLGGTLALAFAEKHSKLISAVVAVDGMPIFPSFERMTPDQRKAAATRMQQSIAQATPEQFRQQQTGYMQTMGVIDSKAAEKYAKLQARSDPATVAQYMFEDLSTDLRPELDKISVPVLEISPYREADFKAAADSGRMPMMSEAQKTDYYRELLKGTPNLKVVSIAPARHFVMLDQPHKFHKALHEFLHAIAGHD